MAERVRGDVFDSIDGPVLLRGIKNEDWVDDNINGNWFGRGVHGNGNYFKSALGEDALPEVFMYSGTYREETGWVYAAKLKPNAKIINADDIADEFRIAMQQDGKKWGFESNEWWEFFNSEGELAAFRGYDAMYVKEYDYYIILNQRSIVVDERMLPGGQFDTRDYVPSDLRRLKTVTARKNEREINERWDEIQQIRARDPKDEVIGILEEDLEDSKRKAKRTIDEIEKRIEVESEKTKQHLQTQVEKYYIKQ